MLFGILILVATLVFIWIAGHRLKMANRKREMAARLNFVIEEQDDPERSISS